MGLVHTRPARRAGYASRLFRGGKFNILAISLKVMMADFRAFRDNVTLIIVIPAYES